MVCLDCAERHEKSKKLQCTGQFEMHLPRKEKKTAATYRRMKNATSTPAATWERNDGLENK